MNISREDKGEVTILRLDGRLIGEDEAGNATHAAVRNVIEEGKRNILLDLAQVPFINSTGVGILVVNFVRLRREEGHLKIVNPSDRLRSLFRTLPALFEIFNDEDEAVASFS